ncbi:hypothetical protein YT1_4649 [Rhodococcus ruber]|nr:hypothetical protein YT1_4649 [Rhodococcus ruber]
MVAVRDGHVPATLAMGVVVAFVDVVLGGLALVDMPVVGPVQMPVVHVVDVVAVRDGHVPAAFAVGVVVACMLAVVGLGHR